MKPSYVIGAVLVLAAVGALAIYSFIENSPFGDLTVEEDSTAATTTLPTTSATTTPQTYTPTEVSKHSVLADCWVTVNGKVYNITSFIPTYTGGKAIVEVCGKDNSVLFNSQPSVIRQTIQGLLNNYSIGVIK